MQIIRSGNVAAEMDRLCCTAFVHCSAHVICTWNFLCLYRGLQNLPASSPRLL